MKWVARPLVKGQVADNPKTELRGNHKTLRGREAFIRANGRPGTTYAVALVGDGGYIPQDTVHVPRKAR